MYGDSEGIAGEEQKWAEVVVVGGGIEQSSKGRGMGTSSTRLQINLYM